jgi:hypothetical protein
LTFAETVRGFVEALEAGEGLGAVTAPEARLLLAHVRSKRASDAKLVYLADRLERVLVARGVVVAGVAD